MRTPPRAIAALAAAPLLALASCAGGPEAGSSASAAASSGSVAASSNAPMTGPKSAADAQFPPAVDAWTLPRTLAGASGEKVRFYLKPNDSSSALRAIISPVPLTQAALDAVLSGQSKFGAVTCGQLAGGTTVACYLALSGGALSVTGPMPPDQLAAVTQHLYDRL